MALPLAPAKTAAITSMPPGPTWPTAVQTALWQLRFPEFNMWLSRRYGNIFTIRLPFSGSIVSFTDPDAIRALFADPGERAHAGEANAILEPMMGRHSVLLLDGPEHARQRKLLHPPFHGARMQRYGQVITEITSAEVAGWPLDEKFSLLRSMQSLTLQVILRVVFGLEEGEKLEHIKALIHRALADGDSPLALIPQARRDFGPLKTWSDFIARRDALDQALYAEMAGRREAGNLEERDDILSMLMVSRDEDGEGMTDVELRDELITLLLAGHETTASSISWFFDQVLHQPTVLARLQEDLATGGTEYLNAAISETMRLRPAVPMIARLLQVPMEIGDFLIPSETVVAPNIFLAHRRADIYPEPLRFRPERFLDTRVDTFAWLPFGGGIRRCVGAAFATFEMQTVIPEVLRRVKLEPISPRPEAISRRAVTLVPAHGAQMRVTARN
jgi:cytochrome P450 family 135